MWNIIKAVAPIACNSIKYASGDYPRAWLKQEPSDGHTKDASLHLVVPPRPICCSATPALLPSRAAALPSNPAIFTSRLHTTCTNVYVLFIVQTSIACSSH